MATLDPALVVDYNKSRAIKKPEQLCHAPFSNMYFNVLGQAAPCWLTFFDPPRYPEHSVRDLWFGQYFEKIRNSIREKDLSQTCKVCERNIQNRLFMNPLARAYDLERPLTDYPSIMEFELSNFCNLECVMCSGHLSSTVRKNRDGLPPRQSPYDDAFVEQLEEFIPHLKEARVNGGEPFLQELCYKLWDKISKINDDVEITVATNGTVWTPKVEKVLEGGKFRVNLSLDGFSKETYESIRVNSNFERVMSNIGKFGAYCEKNNRIFSIMVNPMRNNWWELSSIVDFCNRNRYHVWFNTIYRPFKYAMWNLPSGELTKIRDEMAKAKFEGHDLRDPRIQGNIRAYENLVHGQITTWIEEQKARELQGNDQLSIAKQREPSEEILRTKMRDLFSADARRVQALTKIETLRGVVSRNVDTPTFFHVLNSLPGEMLVDYLENKSLEMIAEDVYYRAEYY